MTLSEKTEFKILSISTTGDKFLMSVEFFYGFVGSTDSDGNTTYDAHGDISAVECPLSYTEDQIVSYLEDIWEEKYEPLDTIYSSLDNTLTNLTGYSKELS